MWWPLTAEGGEWGRLEFAILGPLEVLRSGTRLHLGGRQQRAILALLLCEADRVVSIDRLTDALWGEDPPVGYLTTVQTYIYHLRELLEPDRARGTASRVVTTAPGGGYRLHMADGSLDVVLFEDLVVRGAAALDGHDPGQAVGFFGRALGLWRGEVLGDLAEFGFVAPVAGRLQELRMSAVESRMEALLLLGHHGAAVVELDRLVADYPLREGLHAVRILALYRSGRQADALEAYRRLRAMLHEELGIEPSPPLQVLHRAILAQESALAWDPPPSAPVTTAAPPSTAGNRQGAEDSHTEPTPTPPTPPTPPPIPALVGQSVRRRDRFSRKVLGAWVAVAVVVVVAAGGLTTAIVRLSRPAVLAALAGNSVGAVESDGSITWSVPVGTSPAGLVFGGGSLWVANRSDGNVSRIDPRTHVVVQTIPVGAAPESLTVTPGAVWVTNVSDSTVSRINIVANKVVKTVTVGTWPTAISSGPSGVWVANRGDNTIQRIDPDTNRPDPPLGVGDGPDGIAVDANSVWVANGGDGTVSRIDPKTGQDVSSPVRVGSGPKGIAVSGDEVWVANQLSQSVTRINRSTGRAHAIQVGDGPGSVVVAGASVWVSEEFDGTLSRIDPTSEELDKFALGSSPRGLAVVEGRIWVASGAFAAPTHVGGTLTVATTYLPGHYNGIDPANAYEPVTNRANRQVYDGLVAFRLAPGADSQVLVPDLAVALPTPSNGGKTYTFTLRPGIRYSTGRVVHASDFQLGVRKALTLQGGNPDFFAGIIGGQDCIERPDACDLSAGVLTDDATGRVTFRLTAPDPDFLGKLTHFVVPAPPGTSPHAVTTPLPGTGPYQITSYEQDKTFTLGRNRWFHRWSVAAQPDGYPDVIRWSRIASDEAAVDAVSSGRADVSQLRPADPARSRSLLTLLDQFRVRYPAQFKSNLLASTDYEVLDAGIPPFNNVKARQALSYAVDRNKLVELYGGPSFAVATCQLLPPNFPSYSWYCPYTKGLPDGRYHGPDLAKAQDLVTTSGTRGMPVTVHGTLVDGQIPTIDAYFKTVLSQLGYKVTLHEMPDTPPSYDFLFNPRNHLQAWYTGWVADFPLVSNFFVPPLACGSSNNLGHFCNLELDQRAAAASALQSTDPGAALRAWTQIERATTDQAPLVPTVNQIESTLLSARVGNYQSNQIWGPLLSQLWVK